MNIPRLKEKNQIMSDCTVFEDSKEVLIFPYSIMTEGFRKYYLDEGFTIIEVDENNNLSETKKKEES